MILNQPVRKMKSPRAMTFKLLGAVALLGFGLALTHPAAASTSSDSEPKKSEHGKKKAKKTASETLKQNKKSLAAAGSKKSKKSARKVASDKRSGFQGGPTHDSKKSKKLAVLPLPKKKSHQQAAHPSALEAALATNRKKGQSLVDFEKTVSAEKTTGESAPAETSGPQLRPIADSEADQSQAVASLEADTKASWQAPYQRTRISAAEDRPLSPTTHVANGRHKQKIFVSFVNQDEKGSGAAGPKVSDRMPTRHPSAVEEPEAVGATTPEP